MNKNIKNIIKKNLKEYKGIAQNPKRIEEINNIFVEIDSSGFNQIVDNFCNHSNSNQAYDFLFEAYVCHELLKNKKILNLKYEPLVGNPPDFRFNISDVFFDVQVKMLHNVTNEMVGDVFFKECSKRLSRIPRSLFFHYALGDDFQKKDINLFIKYVEGNIDKFSVFDSIEDTIEGDKYRWPSKDNILVEFCFSKRNKPKDSISIGTVSSNPGNDLQEVDMNTYRKSLRRLFRKSSQTFSNLVNSKQSNIVIMTASPSVDILDDFFTEILYGDESYMFSSYGSKEQKRDIRINNGVLREDTFSRISNVIYVSNRTQWIDFKSVCYPHFLHLDNIKKHPKLFEEMKFVVPSKWGKYAFDKNNKQITTHYT